MTEEKRIYVVLPASVEVADKRTVSQPTGRQIAQACHVSAKLRHERGLTTEKNMLVSGVLLPVYTDITTIILSARDSHEMMHVFELLQKRRLFSTFFSDVNEPTYGNFRPITALATYARPSQVAGILDYLPLWGAL